MSKYGEVRAFYLKIWQLWSKFSKNFLWDLCSPFLLGHQVVTFHLKKPTKTLIIITHNEKAKQNTCAKNNDNRKNHVAKLAFHIKNFFSPYHEHNLDTIVDTKN
jgi:hypothetical protein